MKKHEGAVPRAVGDTLVWQCVPIANKTLEEKAKRKKEKYWETF